MKLNELADNDGARKARLRVGRGVGSGKGKTAARGQKGQKSRSGVSINGFEGGQMPIYRRIPKRGFTNAPFRKDYSEVNIGRLQAAVDDKKLDPKKTVDAAALVASGVLTRVRKDGVRLLAKGNLTAALQLDVAGASKSAVAAVEKAGGKVTLPVKKADDAQDKGASKEKAKKDA